MQTTNKNFNVGDSIRIVVNSHKGCDDGFDYDYFDKYIGKETKIIANNGINVDGVPCYYTNIDDWDGHSNQKLSVSANDIEHVN